MSSSSSSSSSSKKNTKKGASLDLRKWLGTPVTVKFAGGREVTGQLRGYDALANLVLDDCKEYLRDADDPTMLTGETRHLGLVVCRGTAVTTVNPPAVEIANPFAAALSEQAI